jgi:AraC-like DNA-binding protein
MEDLCRVTGVGVRTLQRCFREYFDMTISEYLKTKRLDAARRELDGARPDAHTVTEIALNHGFNHLGRFSVEFKERFGESPGKTLATKEGQKSVVREIPASAFLASANLLAIPQDD